MLNVNVDTIKSLIANQYLSYAAWFHIDSNISAESLSTFMSRYVVLERVCSIDSKHPKNIRATLQESGLIPVFTTENINVYEKAAFDVAYKLL